MQFFIWIQTWTSVQAHYLAKRNLTHSSFSTSISVLGLDLNALDFYVVFPLFKVKRAQLESVNKAYKRFNLKN